MIINLTQHPATAEQVAAGVRDLPEEMAAQVRRLLTFEDPPKTHEMSRRAKVIAAIALSAQGMAEFKEKGITSGVPVPLLCRHVMIGGAPFFMSTLEMVLIEKGLIPLYAFSRRESREETLADGNVRKVAIFRHVGFVPACPPEPLEPGQT